MSYNRLESLNGMEVFANLSYVSLSYNRLMSLSELLHIPCLKELRGISLQGNYLELQPNYRTLVMRMCQKLESIDNMNIDSVTFEHINMAMMLEVKVMPFIGSINEMKNRLELMSKVLRTSLELKSEMNVKVFKEVLTEYEALEDIPRLLNIKQSPIELLEMLIMQHTKDCKLIIEDMRKDLLKRVLEQLKQKKHRDLELYLNVQCLIGNDELKKVVLNNFMRKHYTQHSNEDLITAGKLMLDNKKLNTNKLFNEQANYFFKLCPDKAFPLFVLNDKYMRAFVNVVNNILRDCYKEYKKMKRCVIINWPGLFVDSDNKENISDIKIQNELLSKEESHTNYSRQSTVITTTKDIEAVRSKLMGLCDRVINSSFRSCVEVMNNYKQLHKKNNAIHKLTKVFRGTLCRRYLFIWKKYNTQLYSIEYTVKKKYERSLLRESMSLLYKITVTRANDHIVFIKRKQMLRSFKALRANSLTKAKEHIQYINARDQEVLKKVINKNKRELMKKCFDIWYSMGSYKAQERVNIHKAWTSIKEKYLPHKPIFDFNKESLKRYNGYEEWGLRHSFSRYSPMLKKELNKSYVNNTVT